MGDSNLNTPTGAVQFTCCDDTVRYSSDAPTSDNYQQGSPADDNIYYNTVAGLNSGPSTNVYEEANVHEEAHMYDKLTGTKAAQTRVDHSNLNTPTGAVQFA